MRWMIARIWVKNRCSVCLEGIDKLDYYNWNNL